MSFVGTQVLTPLQCQDIADINFYAETSLGTTELTVEVSTFVLPMYEVPKSYLTKADEILDDK